MTLHVHPKHLYCVQEISSELKHGPGCTFILYYFVQEDGAVDKCNLYAVCVFYFRSQNWEWRHSHVHCAAAVVASKARKKHELLCSLADRTIHTTLTIQHNTCLFVIFSTVKNTTDAHSQIEHGQWSVCSESQAHKHSSTDHKCYSFTTIYVHWSQLWMTKLGLLGLCWISKWEVRL